ncbi:hypothetical protein [Streptomyces sp. KS 21]|uniref:hypothetical protein n=1 Tax=Streptomyces sp. KS 21 TaxID=2485150 RepID=UPI0010626E83|nr:hypothetical protein [Streptomyces sp. KS 21]TDU80691.1 hypothetical protein EDD91_7609 [Streptomyces sp. KS 21]
MDQAVAAVTAAAPAPRSSRRWPDACGRRVVIVLALGVLIAPTPAGEGIVNILGQLASGVTQASR